MPLEPNKPVLDGDATRERVSDGERLLDELLERLAERLTEGMREREGVTLEP